ncbi:MAG: hypothetical protein IPG17_28370 [Sandaracinaceae bacterium]|nr:hypothetical protein [Sandaracinaceae bacterium]
MNQLFRMDGRNVLFTTRGPVIEGEDGVYRWACSQAYGDTGQSLVPNLARTATGPAGGHHRWAQPPPGRGLQLGTRRGRPRVRVRGGRPARRRRSVLRIFAVTADPVPDNYIAYGDDDGASFTPGSWWVPRCRACVRPAMRAACLLRASFRRHPAGHPGGRAAVERDLRQQLRDAQCAAGGRELTLVITHVP